MFTAPFAMADLDVVFDSAKEDLEGQPLPGPLAGLFNKQRINIHVANSEGIDFNAGLVTENKKVVKLQNSLLEKPTLNVYTSEKTVNKITNSANPLKSLQEALSNKEITYKAVGFVNKIKFGVSSLFVKIFGSFQDEGTTIEETKEEPEVVDVTEKKEEVKEKVEEKKVEEPKSDVIIVEITDKGFDPKKLMLEVGDKVEWHNVRTKNPKQAMIVGAQLCRDIRSGIFQPGEIYEWTFDKAITCTIVDGIITTQVSTITVK